MSHLKKALKNSKFKVRLIKLIEDFENADYLKEISKIKNTRFLNFL
jgi:hypothetical protein